MKYFLAQLVAVCVLVPAARASVEQDLATIYATAVVRYLTGHPRVPGVALAAQVHGDTTAFWWAAGIFGLGFLLTLLIMPSQREARSATTVAALARYAIGACNHEDTVDGADGPNGAGSRQEVFGAVGNWRAIECVIL